eukprot:TRINITY_DN15464_c0_g1_i1.p1 TRINITY_DN15464_c0_g1~~TRINITY_DN15464_c0_g1_i1.p1  ORF type:complete len:342 (+),score=122.79 TRINITY_DN15464_c0_g1_i1:39-1028(+)
MAFDPTNEKEWELTPAPTDGITSLRIKDNKFLLVSSWDTSVRLYDLELRQQKAIYHHKAAVLDCAFFSSHQAYSGGIDKTIKSFDLTTGAERVIGSHGGAVKCLEYSPFLNALISGSWDGSISLWDSRGSHIGNYKQPDKVYTMSCVNEKLVVGTAGRHVVIYDLRNMGEPEQRRESSLKYQTRCIRAYPNGTGYALSSIEGRVAMEYFDPAPEVQAKKYAFKCHRTSNEGIETIYPVNSIAFHQNYGTFATGGGDGIVNTWDGQNKKRLNQYHKYPTSISAMAFSEDGGMLAIASSYTFEEGDKEHPADQIYIRNVQDHEVRPKAKQT